MAFNYKIHCNAQTSIYLNRDDIQSAYYNDVKRFPLLSEEEERELLMQFNFGETEDERQKAKEKLIKSNLRFVISIAKKLGTNDTFLDLINEGNIGLIKAIEKYDITKKHKLITYAVSWIVAYIKHYQFNHIKTVIPPNTMKLHNYVKNVTRDFFNKNEREPTPHEIADIIREKFNFKISNLEDVELGKVISIDEKYGFERDSDTVEDSNIYNRKTSSNNIDKTIEEEYKKHQLDFFLGKLEKREKFIVEHVYGIGCEQESFDTIGLKLNLCGERVRQLCNGAVKKMKEYKNIVNG